MRQFAVFEACPRRKKKLSKVRAEKDLPSIAVRDREITWESEIVITVRE
jgi:hypothetical protein